MKNKKKFSLKQKRRWRKRLDWFQNSNGILVMKEKKKLRKGMFKPESIWEHPWVAAIVLILCGVLDFAVFYQLFNSFLPADAVIRWMSVIGVLVAFDLGPVYLGAELKKGAMGLKENRAVEIALVVVFSMVFIGNLWLRIVMKDQLIMVNQISTDSVYAGFFNSGSQINLPYAVFSSLLPLATSVVSGCISFTCSNPVLTKVARLDVKEMQHKEEINRKRSVLKEYKARGDIKKRLLEEDDELFRIAQQYVDDRAEVYKAYVKCLAQNM